MNDKKKKVAAISAVLQYLRTEEDMDGSAFSTHRQPAISIRQNLWGLHGRQTQMNMRTMISMKGFHGWKAR